MQTKKLGFDKERILIVDRAYALKEEQKNSIRQELKRFPGIENVSFNSMVPGRGSSGISMYREGASNEDLIHFKTMYIDEEFLNVLNVQVKDGRMFHLDRLSDTAALVVNESAARLIGYPKPVGRSLYAPWSEKDEKRFPMEILGVIEDFHYESMREEIAPLLFFFKPGFRHRYMMVKLVPGKVKEGVQLVKQQWYRLSEEQPFQYFFLDEDFNNLFKAEVRIGNILSVFTFLSFLIAFLGLLGLVSFEMQQRVKEIGIRKVLGSSERELVILLSRELCTSVLIANLIAWPLTYFVMQRWLSNFVYRIDFPWHNFLVGLVVSLVLALLTVSSHSIRAARANPVDSLRYE
jgi:putative ABC transport system permease protein